MTCIMSCEPGWVISDGIDYEGQIYIERAWDGTQTKKIPCPVCAEKWWNLKIYGREVV